MLGSAAGLARAGAAGRARLVPCAAAAPRLAVANSRRRTPQQLRRRLACRATDGGEPQAAAEPAVLTTPPPQQEDGAPAAAASHDAAAAASNGAAAASAPAAPSPDGAEPPAHLSWAPDASALPPLAFEPASGSESFWTKFKLAFALPWRRFKKDAVLAFKLEGELPDQLQGRFAPGFSVPQVIDALEKAALDPRVKGIAVEIGPLAVGWGKLTELRRYVKLFRDSGKFTIAYSKNASEKEYFLASAFEEFYIPPTANIRLAGFSVAGTFLRGVLDKVGVEPQVQRIGEFKSAGDQLLRRDMSDAQRTQLSELLDDIYDTFLDTVAEARGKTREEVVALLDRGVYDNDVLAAEGWVSGLRYEDELIDDLKKRTGGKEDQVTRVGLSRYSRVSRSAFALDGKKRIAVLRTSGAIIGKASGLSSGSITPDAVIPKLRTLAKDKKIAGVVLRVDSPGGDALASDLMWREIRQLAAKKPVVACMADVAASGGYYMSMAAQAIVAAPLTITGSIGVVTGKLNLAQLYERVGYAKTLLSRGRFAEFLAADNRPFTDDEAALFEESAQYAYRSFRDKAAASRGMSVDDMQAVAQGRVWTGQRAIGRNLVDVLGGLHEAVALVKQAAGIDANERVTLVEVSRSRTSPLQLIGGGASALAAAASLAQGGQPSSALAQAVGAAVLQQVAGGLLPNGLSLDAGMALLQQVSAGRPLALLSDVDAAGLVGTSGAQQQQLLGGSSGGAGGLFDDDEDGSVLGSALQRVSQSLEDLLL